MTPLEKLLRAAEAPPSEYAWASVALGRAEAAELIDHVVQLQENLDRAHARIAELEAAARRCADCGRAARELIALTIAGNSRALWVKRGRDFREALAELVDPDPCSQFDHQGDCQTHGTGAARPCPHARARELLAGTTVTRTGD